MSDSLPETSSSNTSSAPTPPLANTASSSPKTLSGSWKQAEHPLYLILIFAGCIICAVLFLQAGFRMMGSDITVLKLTQSFSDLRDQLPTFEYYFTDPSQSEILYGFCIGAAIYRILAIMLLCGMVAVPIIGTILLVLRKRYVSVCAGISGLMVLAQMVGFLVVSLITFQSVDAASAYLSEQFSGYQTPFGSSLFSHLMKIHFNDWTWFYLIASGITVLGCIILLIWRSQSKTRRR